MKKLILLTILSFSFLISQAQKKSDLRIEKAEVLDNYLPKLMAEADIPGLSIAIAKNDEIVYQKGFGVRSADTREPVTSQTVFSAASLSKALFAYGLMKWVEKGRFDLDRPLYEYFPYPDLEHDERYKRLTARQVLSHTTGLPNWRRGDQLSFVRDPGQEFGYSGEGFVYLMRVVEQLSGQKIDDFMEAEVFRPLGMKRSSYVWQKAFDSDYAIPHDQFMVTRMLSKPEEGNTAYSLQTTAVDYTQFLLAMLNANGLQSATVKKMLEGEVNVEKDDADVQWGLGVGLQSTDAGKAFWHWGDNGTFKAFFIAFPKQKISLIYFANSSNGLGIAHDLLRTCLGGTYPAVDWLDYEAPKAPARMLLQHILQSEDHTQDWPFLTAGGQHQDTTQIAEAPMNRLGYSLLNLQRLAAAERVFKMNRLAFPRSANVYDSYGEVLLRRGKLEAAASAYEQASELDPQNANAKTIAYQIRKGNRQGNTTFQLNAYPYAQSVQLVGDFNNWNQLTHPMVRENGRWTGRIDLEPGTYQYKFVVDGIWIPDPANANVKYQDGHNSIYEKKE